MTTKMATKKQKVQVKKIPIFNPGDFMEQYRKLSVSDVVKQFEKTLIQTIQSSENSVTGLFGTITLSDGREARIELRIDAEYIHEIVKTDNLDLFED